MRRVISNLIKSFIVLIIFVFIIEIIFFFTSSDKIDNFANTQEFQKKYVVRNSHGYRDKEYSYKKPDNIFRILVLGDSQTFGHGIKKLEDTWHKKLEVLMNHGMKDKSFEVISLAGEGWNTDTQLYELFKNGFKYKPDLILLAFYQNDVPSPFGFECQGEDIQLFRNSKVITSIRNYSKTYQFIEYRINRLLERLGHKPTYPECINKRFDSRGWDMEEVYLDTILMSSQIKNIHFMITTIPLVYKLNEEYPIKSSHAKVKNYCAKKGIECLDLYDKGFNGLDHTKLVYSKTDKHLNEKGTEVVAKNLYKKLQPLKTYKNLSKFHGAFDLNQLLVKKPIVKDLDKQFKEIKNNQKIKFKLENEELEVINQGKIFQYTNIISKNTKPTIHKIKLDTKGNFIESEINHYKKNNMITYIEKKNKKNGTIVINYKKKENNIKILTDTRNYNFYRLKDKSPSISPDFIWHNPKTLEIRVFNPRPDMLGKKAEQTFFDAINSFNNEIFLGVSWNNYQKKLINQIIESKPSITSIRAINRINSEK